MIAPSFRCVISFSIGIAMSVTAAGCASRAATVGSPTGDFSRSVRVTNNSGKSVRVFFEQGSNKAFAGQVSPNGSELFPVPPTLDGPAVRLSAETTTAQWLSDAVPQPNCPHLPRSAAAKQGCEMTIETSSPGMLRSKQ